MMQRFAVVAIAWGCAGLIAAGSARAQTCAAPGTATTACTGAGCAALIAPMATGPKNGTVQIPITFTQGPSDGQSGKGIDEVAAIAFTLGAPGSGDAAPLTVACTDGNLAAGVVSGVPDNFTAVIENAQCAGRTHCLCPDTGAGQTLDNYVNIVVYGPRNLPEQGPVQIPVLPASGPLLTLTMQIASDAPDSVPLHVFSALDGSKPPFTANLSIGDVAACDVTATAQNKSNVALTDGKVTAGPPLACTGDCNASNSVLINELIIGVNIALGSRDLSACPSFDKNMSHTVTVNELILAVNNALNGCHG